MLTEVYVPLTCEHCGKRFLDSKKVEEHVEVYRLLKSYIYFIFLSFLFFYALYLLLVILFFLEHFFILHSSFFPRSVIVF